MSELQIRLMGELAVLRAGRPLELPSSKKTRALLAYLILEPGPHRRDRLCELFWNIPNDPRGALRWSLSKLRSLLNEPDTERIVADREHVTFDAAGAHVDVLEMQARLAEGLQDLDEVQLGELAGQLAPECLAGLDLSEALDFHYFLAAARQRTRSWRRAVLDALLERLADQPVEAVPWLQALVELEPFDVDAHRRLVECLALAGRRKDAERQKAVSLAALKDVAGLDPVVLERAVRARPAGDKLAGDPAARSAPPAPPPLQQEIRFCTARDGTRIAYASTGEGPPLVKVANWLNHLEYDWESPVWRHLFRDLSDRRRLVRYDARGNGLSDWNVDDYSFESLVTDLEGVVDACGLERFDLLALSQGCAISVEYAARHPERVSRLVLFGGYARGWKQGSSAAVSRQGEAMMVLVRIGWGQDNPAFRQMFTSLFMPDAPPENHVWFNELQRLSSSPENAARLIRACGEIDVRERLADVRVPTLVLHSRRDVLTPFSRGRELATGIPGARFVSLDTGNHLLPESDPAYARMVAEISGFLGD